MTIGERIEARRKEIGIASQAKLARLVPMGQSTLNGLINNPYRWSPHLPAIARALRTTVDYLVGDSDDPDANAPPAPLPVPARIIMEVVLPPEPALARMFEGLLRMMPADASLDERALLLARRLPIGLSQLRDLLPIGPAMALPTAAPAEAPPIPVAAPRS